jgi:hypothetical protein
VWLSTAADSSLRMFRGPDQSWAGASAAGSTRACAAGATGTHAAISLRTEVFACLSHGQVLQQPTARALVLQPHRAHKAEARSSACNSKLGGVEGWSSRTGAPQHSIYLTMLVEPC